MKRTLFAILIAAPFSCCSNPDKALELYIKGKNAYNKQDFNRAEKFFNESIQNDRSLYNSRLMLSKIYYFRKKFPEALDFLNSIIRDNRNHTAALYWKARIMVMDRNTGSNKENEAMECLREVLELDAHHIRARTMLALIYEKNKKYKEAIYEYKTLLMEEEALVNGRANLAILYKRMGLKDKSLSEMDKAVKIADLTGIKSSSLKFLKKEMEK